MIDAGVATDDWPFWRLLARAPAAALLLDYPSCSVPITAQRVSMPSSRSIETI